MKVWKWALWGRLVLAGTVLGGTAAASPVAAQQSQEVDYARAEAIMGWNASRLVTGMDIEPNWLADGSQFWYRVTRAEGHDFMLVDPARSEQRPLFDNARLAAAMSMAADTAYDPIKLPFTTFDFIEEVRSIGTRVSERNFTCDIQLYRCTVEEAAEDDDVTFVVSPDSLWEAFVHEHDLHLRHRERGDTVRLTHDGEEFWGYGLTAPRAVEQLRDTPRRPSVSWSPDSRYLAVTRTDERGVEHLPMYTATPQRPRGVTYPYALPGDSIIPRPELVLVEVETGRIQTLPVAPAPANLQTGSAADSLAPWSADSEAMRWLAFSRGRKAVRLMEARLGDPGATPGAAGAPLGGGPIAQVRTLVHDTIHSFIDMNTASGGPANWWVTRDGEDIFFFSQRDGWGHLYRYGSDGALKNQVTQGGWEVGDLLHVDEARQELYFTARGREEGRLPYYAHLYRVGFDGSGLTLLTPEEADHRITFSPSGEWFVDEYSRVDHPPVTVVREARTGGVAQRVEEADISLLLELGWRPPRLFSVKARDGVTNLYGLLFLPRELHDALGGDLAAQPAGPESAPAGLDSTPFGEELWTARYPLISHIYPGPQVGSVREWRFSVTRFHDDHAMAQLGFVMMHLDHMGTPHRGKVFHDAYYGDMEDNGIPDHVAAVRQLGARHAFLDTDRVGIYGGSGGAFASVGAMLQYPDVFHAAVARSGNHDNRSYGVHWGEKYQGLLVRDTLRGSDNYESQANYLKAERLQGPLLLAHGDLDDNVHPAMTLRLVHALIEANKDFDFFIMPDRLHGLYEPYFIRRSWDFWVRNLLGKEPPREYEFRRPEG
ncbi:MAG: DPP IV N-terminal domain-containing protein [Gemmatimonadota bacterium]